MNNPLVSVVISTYNWKEKRFSQTLDSVVNQSYKNIEIIIVNDASTNNIENLILKYCKQYSNIFYLKNEQNSERSYSRNRWIFESKWKYIAFIDDDDIRVDKDKIKKQVEFFEKNKEYVLCGTSLIDIDDKNNQINKNIAKTWNIALKNSILQSNQFMLSSVMIKKDVLCFSWLFNSDYNKAEDYELFLRIWRYWKIHNIDDSFILYRTWDGNTTTKHRQKIKLWAFLFMRQNRKYYPNIFRAIILRCWEFILPTRVKNMILKIFAWKNYRE